MHQLLKARLAPFRHRDFRNLFLAQSLSLVGSWSHDLARSWLIVEATGSSGALGNLNLAIAVPCLFLILQGGVLVDRADVRKLIQWTKSLLGISALILAAVTEFSHIQVWQLLVFGIIEGIIVSFDAPAFQALTVRMVPREEFQQAIALNSTNFHASRMLGPVLAAWLMTLHGPSLVFFFDGLSYLIVAVVLIQVKLRPNTTSRSQMNDREFLRDGLKYLWRNKILRYRLAQLLLGIGCVHPMMMVVLRVFVQQKFKLDAHEFGTVFSFPALGSMAGALSFAAIKPREPIRALYVGIPLVFLMLLALPWMESLRWTVVAMSISGFCLYLTFASLTVSLQLDVEESYRGRLSSVIGLGFSALGPLLSFPWGHASDILGPEATLMVSAVIFGTGSLMLALANRREVMVMESHEREF